MQRMIDLGYRDEVDGLGLLQEGLSGRARDIVLQARELTELGTMPQACASYGQRLTYAM